MMNRAERRNYAKKINTPQKLEQYAKNFDYRIRQEYDKAYQEKYEKDLEEAIDYFLIAIAYTLHFNEKTKFGNARIIDFMDDLLAVVDCFKTGEYLPEDYKKQLEEEGIKIITQKRKESE